MEILLPVSPLGMKFKDQQLFLWCKVPSLNVRFQVIQPSESAAFPSPLQS